MSQAACLYQTQEAEKTISVWEQENLRWLEFGDDLIQSVMDLDRPDYLPERFSRAMLAGIAFQAQPPQKILLAGTGGGATARYFSSRWPDIAGDAVELSPAVIDIAQRYFDFPSPPQWQIHQADIRHYISHCQQQYDVIVFDIADGQSVPSWLRDPLFLQQCQQCLSANGHISINLIAETGDHFMAHLATMRQVFNKQTLCLSLAEHRNIILFGFNHPNTLQDNDRDHLLTMERRWQIEFTTFYQQMLDDNPSGCGFL